MTDETEKPEASRDDGAEDRKPDSKPVRPPGDGVPRSPGVTIPAPRIGNLEGKRASGEPDHAGVKAKRDADEARVKGEADARKDRRNRVRGGTLSGKWVPFGSSLVNMDAVTAIDLPNEGEENPTLTVTTFGGKTVSVSGDEAREIMDELQLRAIPKQGPDTSDQVMREDGRILNRADHEADEKNPGRIASIPNHPHRANAVLTNAETDFDVTNRAGSVAVPPTREVVSEPTPEGDGGDGDSEKADSEDATGKAESGDEAATPAAPPAPAKAGRGSRKSR